jgi:hypothetical protein
MGTLSVPSRNYQVGEDVIAARQRADRNYNRYSIEFTRESWPAGVDFIAPNGAIEPNTAVVVFFEQSSDGVNWISHGSAWFAGGILLDRQGNPELTAHISIGDEDATTKAAELRVRVVRLVPLRTAVTINVIEP